MIHKAQVLAHLPGDRRWLHAMQTRRTAALASPGTYPDFHYVPCAAGEIALKKPDGQVVDDGHGLEYEFVRYNRATRTVIIAMFVGTDSESPDRVDALFPNMGPDEALLDDRVFLIASPTGKWASAWLLAPTGDDAHSTFGLRADPSYVDWLVRQVSP